MTRKNFSFRYDWQKAIAGLDPEIRLEIYECTVRYAETGELCFSTDTAAEAFNKYILPDFKRREKAAEYRARRKARREPAETEVTEPVAEPINEVAESAAETAESTPDEPMVPLIPAGPNRRERRLMEAEAKRLAKRKKRNALARKANPPTPEAPTSDSLISTTYFPVW
ncbi:MAG: hypothetical protein HDT06_04175 [Bacteroidales bacterium]|nr:hypothetical protein [Bacteroidales bacterium]